MTTPEHHTRYRNAWLSWLSLNRYDYNNSALDEQFRLEDEMDQAQNDFTWDEFQQFKITLPFYFDIFPDIEIKKHIEIDVDWVKEGF